MVITIIGRVLDYLANRRLSDPLSFPEAAQRLHSWPGPCLGGASRPEHLSARSGRSSDRRPAGLVPAEGRVARRVNHALIDRLIHSAQARPSRRRRSTVHSDLCDKRGSHTSPGNYSYL